MSCLRPLRSYISRTIISLFIGCVGLAPGELTAQRLAVGDGDEAYLRVLQLLGKAPATSSMMIRPLPLRAMVTPAEEGAHPWTSRLEETYLDSGEGIFHLHDPQIRGRFHSLFPESRNEGALWAGRWLTGAVEGGVTARQGPLSVSLRPMVAWVQNGRPPLAEVEVTGQPEYAYPFWRIDTPQQFGPDPFWMVDPGQSEIRLDYRGVSTSFGTTNLWWGPGIRNGILMSNNAAGIPHLALETSRPISTGIGTFEAQWVFGRLQGTEWFAPRGDDPGRYLTGAVFTYSPSFFGLRGLSLGGARVFVGEVPVGGLGSDEYLLAFKNPQSVDAEIWGTEGERDQIASVFGRWLLPESGFEAYFEWARDDRAGRVIDYFLVAGETQAFTLGFQKASELEGGEILVFRGEVTQLEERPNPARTIAIYTGYYRHNAVERGYTQKGQIIGAAAGIGGNVQFLGADFYSDWGGASAFVERLVRDKSALNMRHGLGTGGGPVDAQLTLGGAATLFRGPLEFKWTMERAWRFNPFFKTGVTDYAFRFALDTRWRIGSR